VIERFFLDRVDAEPRRPAVGGERYAPVDVLANETKSTLAFLELAQPRAQLADDPTIVERAPVTAGDNGVHVFIDAAANA
jgi:hypothetical protein